jgi:hypothetical protein
MVHIGFIDILKESGPCRSTAQMPLTLYDHMAVNLNGRIVLCGGHYGHTMGEEGDQMSLVLKNRPQNVGQPIFLSKLNFNVMWKFWLLL